MAVAARLDVRGLVLALAEARVDWILAGSLAALAWGPPPWPYPPSDLDAVPDTSSDNLERLARCLHAIGARPAHLPEWPGSLSPEQRAAWTPWPASEEQLDHLLETALGRLDVVPWRAGRFAKLKPGAARLRAWGAELLVAAPVDLESTMRPATKEKHAARAAWMRVVRERAARGEGPCGLEAGGESFPGVGA